MAIKNPDVASMLIMADDPYIAAQLSSRLGRRGVYLPVIDGPRLARPDADVELNRRTNAAARAMTRLVLLTGLTDESATRVEAQLPKKSVARRYSVGDVLPPGLEKLKKNSAPLNWGRERIGLGLLKALRENRILEIDAGESPTESIPSISGHLVVVEAGEALSEVIAANYAFALGAGLHVIPEIDTQVSNAILERFYNLQDRTDESPTQKLAAIKADLRGLCGEFDIPAVGSITFITRDLPFGFAFPEVPTTHLFRYPDLGVAIINGFIAEARGEVIGVSAFVDPEVEMAPEVQEAVKVLRSRGVLIRGHQERAANVRDVAAMVTYFPYDFLVFATHCGDLSGSRWTYEFTDSENLSRRLVVDVAVGFGRPNEDGFLSVTEYFRFHSLDGVRWMDPERWETFYVGKAILDWIEMTRGLERLKPVIRAEIPRVTGAAALKMFDSNYLPTTESVACNGSPIVLNNACVSWLELASRFTFAGVRAYIGCLVPITGSEAFAVTTRLLGKHIDKQLPHALWSSQNDAFGTGVRRPYVVTGVYTQRIRTKRQDVRSFVLRKLRSAQVRWVKQLRMRDVDEGGARRINEIIKFYQTEVSRLSGGRAHL